MNEIILTREEATIILRTLKSNWIPIAYQKQIFELIERLERELGLV